MTALVRTVHVVLGIVALSAGLALGSGGCGWRCECSDPAPAEPGLFEIIAADGRPELIGGTVDAVGETVTIRFVDAEAVAWTVIYDVVAKVE